MQSVLLWIAALAGAAQMPPASATTVEVAVANVRNARGNVRVELCPEARFLKESCPIAAEAPARKGVTLVTIRNVPPGRYAAQATHDENGNGHIDYNFLGIPKEGVAFSRDAMHGLSRPKFEGAAFVVSGQAEQRIGFTMKYLL